MIEISDEDMGIMHDLITQINRHHNLVEDDIRDLNNLIHVIKGDGIRQPEFIQRHKEHP
jgi:hypothetical protein